MLLGIDISEREVAVILARPDGSSELALRAPLPRVGGANAAWLTIVESVREILLQSHVVASQIESAGVAFFAPLESGPGQEGIARKDSRSASWAGFDLRRALREHLGIENSTIEKRAVCAGLAEQKFGVLRDCNDWLYVQLGQTVEAAACVNGVLLRGRNRAATELGAVCIDRDGALGESGRRGVLDAYCGEQAFTARARSYGLTFQTAREIWDNSAANAMAKSQCDDYLQRLSQGIGAACALLNPAQIVLGGEMFSEMDEKILPAFQARLREYCLPIHFQDLQVSSGQLGNDAAVLGAILLAATNNSKVKP